MVSGFMTNLSVHSMKPRNMVSWFRGFMVSWFHPIHLWDIEKPSGFMVSWFRGFMVSSNPSLDDEKPIGFMVSWFHGFIQSISGTLRRRQVAWFRGFMVSSDQSLLQRRMPALDIWTTPTS